jgi:hypothetical protein
MIKELESACMEDETIFITYHESSLFTATKIERHMQYICICKKSTDTEKNTRSAEIYAD